MVRPVLTAAVAAVAELRPPLALSPAPAEPAARAWARRREDSQPVVRPTYRPDPALAAYRERILNELGEEAS